MMLPRSEIELPDVCRLHSPLGRYHISILTRSRPDGSFDKYAESAKGKKGTTEVDDAFLKEIESWRDQLARNIAIRNPKLSQRELKLCRSKDH